MNATAMAQRAYAPSPVTAGSDRSVEYNVIARITARLKAAIQAGQYPRLMEALHENALLWRTLAIDVADAENGLPQALRANIFYLSEFTQEQTRKVIRKGDSPVPLLEVNMAILRGLAPQEPEK